MIRGISDGSLFLNADGGVRAQAMATARATGATVARIQLYWSSIVKVRASAGFDPRDPASGMYDFTSIDAAIRSAVGAGLTPLLVVSHAPEFAEAPGRWPYAYPGSWAPDPAALQDFAIALARRYSGVFPDPLVADHVLPRVGLYQAWNEPNLPRFLEPQWVVRHGHWIAFSPLLYRQLLNAFYAGIKAVDARDLVISAGVAPNGDPVGVGRMAPVTFLEEMLCLQADGGCSDPPHLDVLSFHPLSVGNPDRPAVASLDVSIADAAKVTGLLRAAERRHTVLPASSKQVWVTELNWESAPASPRGVPARLQAAWLSRALHRLWVAGVGLVDWQFLVDPYPSLRLGEPTGGAFDVSRPAGLYQAGVGGALGSATPKPFLRGFTLPFDPLRLNRGRVRVWALLRHAGAPVALQRLARGHRWETIARLRADRKGVLNVLVSLKGAAVLRVQNAGKLSAVARVSSRRTTL
jgi:hypothetical protein